MQDKENRTNEQDSDLAALMKAAGLRTRATPENAADVRSAVEAEWRAVVASRKRRRRITAWAAAAAVGAAAVAVWLSQPSSFRDSAPVASLERVEGDVEYLQHQGTDWLPAPTALSLASGDRLRTGSSGRVALRLGNGVQLRLDTGTQVALLDSRHATLARGGVYVDSGAGADARAGDLEIDTPLGGVRHLGTQYQARLLDGSLLVAVREGRVEVDARTGSVVAMAGEQLAIADTGVTRSALPADAGQWAWIGLVTPPFSIDGKSVEAFLEWAARETGRSIDYASPAAASRAREIVLRGSVAGLTPEQAVAAVLSTTPLRLDLQRDRIRIEAPGS